MTTRQAYIAYYRALRTRDTSCYWDERVAAKRIIQAIAADCPKAAKAASLSFDNRLKFDAYSEPHMAWYYS